MGLGEGQREGWMVGRCGGVSCLAGSSLEASRAGLSWTRPSCHPALGGTQRWHVLQDPMPYHQLSCVWGRE